MALAWGSSICLALSLVFSLVLSFWPEKYASAGFPILGLPVFSQGPFAVIALYGHSLSYGWDTPWWQYILTYVITAAIGFAIPLLADWYSE